MSSSLNLSRCFRAMAALGVLTLCSLNARAQSFAMFGSSQTRITLAIRSDGSGALTNDVVEPRKSLEFQVASWERYSKMAENSAAADEEENATPAVPPKKPEPKALNDEQLAAKLREMYAQRRGFDSEDDNDSNTKIQTLELSTNSVRIVTVRPFASLKDLLSQSLWSWGPNMLMFEDARFELDTNQQFRLTFTPAKTEPRYTKRLVQGWKSSKVKFEWKLLLPGKVLSSGLPAAEANATWVSLDAEKPETLDAALKLAEAPVVITAEPAGLKLEEPLNAAKIARAAFKRSRPEPDIPVTDAGPGFAAEPVSLSISTLHLFPEAEKYHQKIPSWSYGMGTTGTVVSAKLFPPKGRQIKNVSGLRVKLAKDDKGRPVPTVSSGSNEEQDEADMDEQYSFSSSDDENRGGIELELHLGLPAPDAQAIDQLEAEAVAFTFSEWKELVLTNVQADAKKEIDLSTLVPGAKMVVKKVNAKKPQITVEAVLQGPPAVRQLDAKIKLNSRNGGSSSLNDRRPPTSGTNVVRNITIQGYEFDMNGGSSTTAPVTVLVRYPQEMKRERVKFKLTALDLL